MTFQGFDWRFATCLGCNSNAPCALIILATLVFVAIRCASLSLASYSRSMASLLVDFVSQATVIVFYGSVANDTSTLRAIWSLTTGSTRTV